MALGTRASMQSEKDLNQCVAGSPFCAIPRANTRLPLFACRDTSPPHTAINLKNALDSAGLVTPGDFSRAKYDFFENEVEPSHNDGRS